MKKRKRKKKNKKKNKKNKKNKKKMILKYNNKMIDYIIYIYNVRIY